MKRRAVSAVLEALGFRVQAECNEAVYDPGLFAVALPNEWVVVFGDGSDELGTMQPEHGRAQSVGTEAVFFTCNDSSMCAAIRGYRDGEELWSLQHDGSQGPPSVALAGNPPSIVKETLARLQDEQRQSGEDDVDHVYDASPQIGLALTGFRHDETLSSGEHVPIFVLDRQR